MKTGRSFNFTVWSAACCVLLTGCATYTSRSTEQVQFGVVDAKAASAIDRINELSDLRKSGKFDVVASKLNGDLKKYSGNAYAQTRIRNELAEIYTYNLLDLEAAVAIDRSLISQASIQDTTGAESFKPQHRVASQRAISDAKYLDEFVNISDSNVMSRAKDRLRLNENLLAGQKSNAHANYDNEFLKNHLAKVKRDLGVAHPGTPDYTRILSRLIRAELENIRKISSFKLTTTDLFRSGTLLPEDVNLTEISFLDLADYFVYAFRQSGDIRYAEWALDTVYRPYSKMTNPSYRWKYNKLINEYISVLIEKNYEEKKFDELLYYTSLNKSRMLLEERLAFGVGQPGADKVADLTINDGITRTKVGLPDKTWFKRLLANSSAYLDFYVGGKYVPQTSGATPDNKVYRSTMPLNTRDFGVEDTASLADTFVDDVLYVTQVDNGKIVGVKRFTGKQLAETKSGLNSSYSAISDVNRGGDAKQMGFFQTLKREANFPSTITVSPDKWVAKHPLDFHLGTKVTRSVNFFTSGKNSKISSLSILGFFNPTLDLAGAEQEADAIQAQVPGAKIFKREAASISALKKADTAPLLHLSMHGQFNATDPKFSRLAFSGAVRGSGVTTDPNSLYAKDMYQYEALKDRELIFAAACQTGLSAADQANENELMGILRPLTASRNKNIILSLWKVDDSATKDFVSAFYQHLVATKDIAESFHVAQDQIRAKYKKPYYWAAFYLSQAR